MIPISDSNRHDTTPYVGNTIIAICILIYVVPAFFDTNNSNELFIHQFAVVPARLFEQHDWWTLLTSAFLHGGIIHLFGNMLFIHIFADNVEHAFGHLRFALFYLFAALFTSFVPAVIDPSSTIPSIGASGAIMAACGAYCVLFPRAYVTMFFLGWRYQTVTFEIRAYQVMIYWFILDVTGAIWIDTSQGGISYWAHISGFLLGLTLSKVLRIYNSDYDGHFLQNGVWVQHKIRSGQSDLIEAIDAAAEREKRLKKLRRPVTMTKSDAWGSDKNPR